MLAPLLTARSHIGHRISDSAPAKRYASSKWQTSCQTRKVDALIMKASIVQRSSCHAIAFCGERASSNGSRTPQTQDPNSALLTAVERGLSLIGENFAEIFFHNLRRRYALGRQEISRNPERFIQALHDMFGDGAHIIERFIKQAICADMGLNPSVLKTTSLLQYIKNTQQRRG